MLQPSAIADTRTDHAGAFALLRCPKCNANSWHESPGTLTCLKCEKALPRHANIVSLASSSDGEWESHYQSMAEAYSPDRDRWTLDTWRKHLFAFLPALDGKYILDFGCGTSARVATLIPPEAHHFQYFGIDGSIAALTAASRRMPAAAFLHSHFESDSFCAEGSDVALCLGVLMYSADPLHLLERIIDSIKASGVLLLHEQLKRRSWGRWLPRRDFSPSALGVDSNELLACLASRGRLIHVNKAGSPLRRPARALLKLFNAGFLWKLMMSIDIAWCATIGRLFPALGAGEIQIVLQKN